jgi:hypothetical protein
VRRHPQRLTDGEDAHGDDNYVDAVAELGDAESEPSLPTDCVDADETDGQADGERDEAS